MRAVSPIDGKREVKIGRLKRDKVARIAQGFFGFAAAVVVAKAASAQGGIAYVCVEERSVGWEYQKGERAVGQFKPSDSKIILKWSPEKLPKLGDTSMLVFPNVEATEDQKTYKYDYAECDVIYTTRSFLEPSTKDEDEECLRKMSARRNQQTTYGRPNSGYTFSKDPRSGDKSITFTYFLIFGPSAYLTGGTCVRLD